MLASGISKVGKTKSETAMSKWLADIWPIEVAWTNVSLIKRVALKVTVHVRIEEIR